MKKIILLVILIVMTSPVFGLWDDCPRGEVECNGECGLFIDTDNDGVCDHSQPAPEDRIETINTENPIKISNSRIYHLIPISIILTMLYIGTLFLVKRKKTTLANQRKIWNIMLTIAFLVSGMLGLIAVIKINFNLTIPYYPDILFWHVEFGIAMAIISIFHIIWHWKYYENMFRKNARNNQKN